jgi:hypothetical protein
MSVEEENSGRMFAEFYLPFRDRHFYYFQDFQCRRGYIPEEWWSGGLDLHGKDVLEVLYTVVLQPNVQVTGELNTLGTSDDDVWILRSN